MVWILHKLGIVKGVWLKDFQGKVYRTFKHKDPFRDSEGTCFVYPFTRIGFVVLCPDGTTKGRDYIKRWKYMEP